MGVSTEVIEKAVGLAAGCVAIGAGITLDSVMGGTVSAVALLAAVTKQNRKHGLESSGVLDSVRRRAREAAERETAGLGERLDIAAADRALEAHLADCFLDRDALVASTFDARGFPARATEIVMAALAQAAPASFGPEAPEGQRDYAGTVVAAALRAALEAPEYFRLLEPRLTTEQNSRLAQMGEQLGRMEDKLDANSAKLDAILAALNARGAVAQVERDGMSEAQVVGLIADYIRGGLSFEQIEARLPSAPEELRQIRQALGGLTNNSPEVAALRVEAGRAVSAGQLDRARALLRQAIDLDDPVLERIKREKAELAEREKEVRLSKAGSLALSARIEGLQTRLLDAAETYLSASELAEPVDVEAAWEHYAHAVHALREQSDLRPDIAPLLRAADMLETFGMGLAARAGPNARAAAEVILASVFWRLGQRGLEGERDDALIRAAAACRRALEIYTLEQAPERWADARTELSICLRVLGERRSGDERAATLAQAVDEARLVVDAAPLERWPKVWARAQSSLATAMQSQAFSDGKIDVERLREAIAAHELCLQVYDSQTPIHWAVTLHNIGNGYRTLGQAIEDDEAIGFFRKGADAYDRAAEVYAARKSDKRLIETLVASSICLRLLAFRLEGDEQIAELRRAETASSRALSLWPTNHDPVGRAALTVDHVAVLGALAELTQDTSGLPAAAAMLAEAVAALERRGAAAPAKVGRELLEALGGLGG